MDWKKKNVYQPNVNNNRKTIEQTFPNSPIEWPPFHDHAR